MKRNQSVIGDSMINIPDRRFKKIKQDIDSALENNNKTYVDYASMQISALENEAKRKEKLLKYQSYDYTTTALKN